MRTGRSKRGIFDGVGQGFKWLFGVATSSDLVAINDRVDGFSKNQEDIVHLMDHQATIMNETLWEVRQTSVVISNLTTALIAVDKKVKSMYSQLEVRWSWTEDAFNLYLEVDDLFNEIDTVLSSWDEQLSELEIGFATLATGRLPQTIFGPNQLRIVLGKISSKLPTGWSLTTRVRGEEDLWGTYREADVSVAFVNDRLRIFIRIPIYEPERRFTLYRVFSLPVPHSDGMGASRVSNLQDLIAVSRDSFVELSTSDAAECSKGRVSWCRFHSAIGKMDTKSSCVWATFSKKQDEIRKLCKLKFSEWAGTVVVYLGERRWGISSAKPEEMVLNCPSKDRQVMMLPTMGVIEIPSGCAAHSREWLFPASIEGKIEAEIEAVSTRIPNVREISIAGRPDEPTTAATVEMRDEIEAVAAILKRNTAMTVENEMTGKAIKDLAGRKWIYSHTYPFEWILAFLVLVGFGIWQWWSGKKAIDRLTTLEERMRCHEMDLAGEDAVDPVSNVQ